MTASKSGGNSKVKYRVRHSELDPTGFYCYPEDLEFFLGAGCELISDALTTEQLLERLDNDKA